MSNTAKRDPKWARDEIILALNLYFKVDINKLSKHEEAIVQLSELLQKLNIYKPEQRTSKFRNPNGVHMKLINFYNIEHPGKGLKNTSELDRQIYAEFFNNKVELETIANKIIETVSCNKQIEAEYENEGFFEGEVLEKQHKYKERNPKATKAKKASVLKKQGYLQCEVCGFIFENTYGELGKDYIECHHIVPLSEIDVQRETKISDLALVCANCHRMLHRKKPLLSIQDLKKIISSNSDI